MKTIGWLTLLVLAGCAAKDTVRPQVKSLVEAVYASGFVVADNEYQVFSQADGAVKEILVSEGSTVEAGQGILVIESNQQDARYRLAKETYDLARINYGPQSPVLLEAENQVKNMYAKYQLDSMNYVRYQNLWKANATRQVEYDRAELAYKSAANDFQSARKRLERTRNDMALNLQQAESQWRIAAEESGNYVVTSKTAGMVFRITRKPGELVRRGELIAVVGKKDKFHLELSVDELDVNRVQEGQPIWVKIEAYGDKLFEGKVTKVYPLVDVRQQSLKVDATLLRQLPGWFSGLAVEANIVVQQKDKALVLPKAMLLPGDSVTVWVGGESKKVKVERGIETLEEVEIKSGITAETQLVK
ncbi:MAG: efflux RND transporter periplasmic adaptor subunit [Bacteroidota bacterium]